MKKSRGEAESEEKYLEAGESKTLGGTKNLKSGIRVFGKQTKYNLATGKVSSGFFLIK